MGARQSRQSRLQTAVLAKAIGGEIRAAGALIGRFPRPCHRFGGNHILELAELDGPPY